jgi:4-amino-4-deoxy-L-arabinose transferase-like glycosyltransferase
VVRSATRSARRRLDSPARFRRRLTTVAAGGLALRVAYVLLLRRGVAVTADAAFYHHAANLLAEGKGFLDPLPYRASGATQPGAAHPPLYVLYLAAFSVVGLSSPTWHMLASCLLGTATVVVVGVTAREVVGPRAGLIAAALVAVYPNTFQWDGLLLSESSALLLVALVVLVAYRYLAAPSQALALWLGALVALATLTRPELLLLGLVLAPVILGRHPTRATAVRVAAAAAMCGLLLVPWVAYNLTRFDHPVLLSTNGEVTLASGTCDATWYGPQTGYWSPHCLSEAAASRPVNDGDESDTSVADREWFFDYARHHLARAPLVFLARVARTAGIFRPVQQARLELGPEPRTKWVAYAGAIAYYLVVGLAVAGVFAFRRRGIRLLPVLAPVIVVLATVGFAWGSTRYRATAEPSLCLLAAVAIDAALAPRR